MYPIQMMWYKRKVPTMVRLMKVKSILALEISANICQNFLNWLEKKYDKLSCVVIKYFLTLSHFQCPILDWSVPRKKETGEVIINNKLIMFGIQPIWRILECQFPVWTLIYSWVYSILISYIIYSILRVNKL